VLAMVLVGCGPQVEYSVGVINDASIKKGDAASVDADPADLARPPLAPQDMSQPDNQTPPADMVQACIAGGNYCDPMSGASCCNTGCAGGPFGASGQFAYMCCSATSCVTAKDCCPVSGKKMVCLSSKCYQT